MIKITRVLFGDDEPQVLYLTDRKLFGDTDEWGGNTKYRMVVISQNQYVSGYASGFIDQVPPHGTLELAYIEPAAAMSEQNALASEEERQAGELL